MTIFSRSQFNLIRVTIGGVALLLALALFSIHIVRQQIQEQDDARALIIHTLRVVRAIDQTWAALQNLEIGPRNYFLTHDPHQRDVFASALAEFNRQVAQLRELTRNNPLQQTNIDKLQLQIGAHVEQVQTVFRLLNSDPAAALTFIKSGADEQQIIADRTHIEAIEHAEDQLLQQRLIADETASRRGRALLFSLMACSYLLVAGLLTALIYSNNQRRRANEQLETNTRLLRSISETMAQGLLVIDTEMRLVRWNERWRQMLQLPETLCRTGADFKPVLELLAQRGDLEQPAQTLIDNLHAHVRQRLSARFTWRDHCGAWIESQSQPMPDGNYVITYTDITALKQAERQLSDQAARLNAIFDNAMDAIVTINESGGIESVNRTGATLFGHSVEAMLGRNVRMLMPEPYASAHDNYLRRYISTGETRVIGFRREVEGLRRDGSVFPLELSVSEMQLGDKRLFVGMLRDVSERRVIERLKSEFISTVSHELRTPLTSIAGSLGLLANGSVGALPTKAERLVNIAHHNCERLVRLINDLLDVEKIESGNMEFRFQPLALSALAAQTIEANRGFADNYQVKLDFVGSDCGRGEGDDRVLADADRLTQVITNLLSNAIKFSPRGGTVTLAIIDRGDALRLSVHDNGSGIPEAFRAQIFGRFVQADASDSRAKSGTGLGLNISKSIVERHGGHIGFDTDTAGGGTTFWIDLQKWHEVITAGDAAADAPRVLICEDDATVAQMLEAALSTAGLNVDIASTMQSAQQLLAAHDYAAMTLDLTLPDGDGLTLLQTLREHERTNTLPVIVVSATLSAQHQLADISALRIAGWLHKPVRAADVTAAVHSVVQNHSSARLRVLHVEDDADVIQIVRSALQNIATVVPIRTLAAARELLFYERFDSIVLDLSLPDGSGLELLETLHKLPITHAPPVVIFSAQDTKAEVAAQVHTALIKSKASIDELVVAIQALANDPQRQARRTDSGETS